MWRRMSRCGKARMPSDRPPNNLRASPDVVGGAGRRDICESEFYELADGVTMAGGHGQGACRPCPKGVSREAANINSGVCSGGWFGSPHLNRHSQNMSARAGDRTFICEKPAQ